MTKQYGWFIKDNASEIAKERYPGCRSLVFNGDVDGCQVTRLVPSPDPISEMFPMSIHVNDPLGDDTVLWVDPDMLERREFKQEVTDADIGAWFKAANEFCKGSVTRSLCKNCPAMRLNRCSKSVDMFDTDVVRKWLEGKDK